MQRSSLWLGLLALVTSLSARADVLWKGDFSTGDLSQWSKLEITADDRLQVVPDPEGGDRQALRVLVRKGDDPIGASGYRNEVLYTKDLPKEGEDRYYRWQTYWPEDYQSADTWQLFTQWHHYDGGGSPPVSFYVRNEEIVLASVDGSEPLVFWTTPLQRGRWHDFVFHVKWSSDPSRGSFELWHDGKLALSSTPVRTLFPGDSVYLKQGLYRDTGIAFDQVLFHTGMTVGTTLDAVWPPEPEPEPVAVPGKERQVVELPSDTLPGETGRTVSFVRNSRCSQAGLGAGVLALLGLVARRRRGGSRSIAEEGQ